MTVRYVNSTIVHLSRYQFTGKERDAESGLDYFGARYYGSSMGRFMSPDWSAKAEPVPYADLTNPQSLNLYGYAGNNPLSRADADGHFWQELGNLLKYNHYVNNAGLEAALQGDADAARQNISGYKNLVVNGTSPANALNGLNNQQTVDLDRSLTNFFENNMLSSKGTQLGLAIATFGAEGLEARVVSGIEAANGTVITGFTEHGVDRDKGSKRGRFAGSPISGLHWKGRPRRGESVIWTNRFCESIIGSWSALAMSVNRYEYKISTEQAAYLRKLASDQLAFDDLLKGFGLQQIDGNTLTIYPQEAEALREYFTERLAKVGFDAQYKPNEEGAFLERFIDDLFTPASQD